MPAPSEITLDQFAAVLHGEIERFVAKWRIEHAADPDNWPATLIEAEWHEQFMAETM